MRLPIFWSMLMALVMLFSLPSAHADAILDSLPKQEIYKIQTKQRGERSFIVGGAVNYAQARHIIETKHYWLFSRTKAMAQKYADDMDEVSLQYESVEDKILITVFDVPYTSENRKKAIFNPNDTHFRSLRVFKENDYPYALEGNIEHWLLWSGEKMDNEEASYLINARFPSSIYHTIFFENPVELRTIPSVVHWHVFVQERLTQNSEKFLQKH